MECEITIQDRWVNGELADPLNFSRDLAQMPWESWFITWLQVLQPTLSPISAYELSLRLTNDLEIQALNAQYRQRDQPTDVLSFAALEDLGAQSPEFLAVEPLYLGDIVISVETAIRQAPEHGYAWQEEVCWLATHGLLHLLGWDHPNPERLQSMLHQQDLLLQAVYASGAQGALSING